MYGLIWRLLPGPVWLRVVLSLLLVALVVVALFGWVFPWASNLMPFNNQTIDTGH